jgi:glutathione S-transferase
MKLYFTPGACSMAAHILFNEWGITHSLEKVDLKTHKTEGGQDFYKINPKGYVPALQTDNGTFLTENIAILAYISDLQNSAKTQNYRFLEILAFISTELHKGIGSLFAFKEPQTVEMIKNRVHQRLKFVDGLLKGREFIFEDDFSAADAYLITILNWCPQFQIDLTSYSNITDYLKRMMQRLSVQRTLQQEGLV